MESYSSQSDENYGRMVAIISYLYVPGWIIALILNSRRRTELGSFHLRQSLGLVLMMLILFFLIRWRLVTLAIHLVFIVFGLLAALNYERKELPGVGGLFNDWFRSL